MGDLEVTRIRIEDYEVGVVGLEKALRDALSCCDQRDDSVISAELLESLSKLNYIPLSAKQKYSEAFLKEFKKIRGDKIDETQTGILDIKVLGPGCYQCDSLLQTVMKVLSQMGQPASLEHITDLKMIAQMGFFRTPALIINGKVFSSGSILSEKRIQEIIEKNAI